ncbi:MAG: MFS transporter [Candidatus Thermoplasmatota archaeon]|nr:MFS transporter [Candidatus Thermoplasmatota archaeon]
MSRGPKDVQGTRDGGKGLKRTVRTLGAASFLNDMGSDMIYPVWPLFVTQFLGANMVVLGLLDGLGEALVSISKAFSGYLSDRIGRRKIFIWTGYLMGSLSRIGYALSPSWGWLIPFRVLDRAGKIRSPPRDAMVADVSSDRDRGGNFGFIRSMDHLGAVVGVLIAVALFSYLGYRKLFLLAAVPSLIAVVLIFWRIRDRRPGPGRTFRGIKLGGMSPDLRLFMVISGIFALGSFSYSFLLIFSREAGVGTGSVPLFYLLFTAVASTVSILFGKLSDRIGRRTVIAISFAMWALVCLFLIVSDDILVLVLAFVLFGLHKGSLEPVQKTLVSELAPSHLKAASLGGYQMVIGLCALPSSLGAGLIWTYLGSTVPFMISLCLTGISLVLLMFMRSR